MKDKLTAKKIFGKVPFKIIGKTKKEKKISVKVEKKLFDADLYELKRAWQEPIKKIFP